MAYAAALLPTNVTISDKLSGGHTDHKFIWNQRLFRNQNANRTRVLVLNRSVP